MDDNPCKELIFGTCNFTLDTANPGWKKGLLIVLESIPHDAQGHHTLSVTYEVGSDRTISNIDNLKVTYNGKDCVIKHDVEKEPDIPSNLIEECDDRDLHYEELNYLITK